MSESVTAPLELGQTSEAHFPEADLPLRLAKLALPLFVALALAFALYGGGGVRESLQLLTFLNTLFGVAISLLISNLAGLSFLRTGALSHLFLGVGSLTFAIAYLLPMPLMPRSTSAALAFHNIGVLLAGVCFLLSARWAMSERPENRRAVPRQSYLAIALAVPLIVMGLVLWGLLAGALPAFYVDGLGMTPLRQGVLGAAAAAFFLSSLSFGVLYRRAPWPFLSWYSLGLALIGLGLATMIASGTPGTPLGWVGRSGQYLGSLYLLIAVLSVGKGDNNWRIPLEQALRKSEAEFRSLFDLFAVGMAQSEPTTGRLTRVNEKFCEITGYSHEELLGLTTSEITLPEDRAEDRAAIERALRREVPGWTSVKRYRRKDGTTVWVQVTGTVLFNAEGRPWQTTAVVQDITARVAADAQRERSDEKIRHLASFPELAPTPIVELDLSGDVTFRNAAALETLRELGLPDDARVFLPAGLEDLFEAARRGAGQLALAREVAIGGRIFGERVQALPALGVVRIFARDLTELKAAEADRAGLFERLEQAHAELERKVQERTADLHLTVRQLKQEVGGRIDAELALRRGEERLRALAAYTRSLIDASLDPLAAIATDGTITDVNPAMEEVTGLPRERLVGRNFSELVAEPAQVRAAYRQAIATGYSRDSLLTIRHVQGRVTEVLLNASVYRNAAGSVAGIFAAARDVTERNASMRRLRVTSELLQLFQRVVTRQQYLDAVVGVVKAWSGCECVGIRIDDGAGCLAYEAHTGFDGHFLETELSLGLEQADCICTRAALGTALDTDRGCMTDAGSFRCDDTPEFAAALDERQRAAYRGHCFRKGFASLAAIPIRYRDRMRGLIHLADRRAGAVPPATVAFLEYVVPLIGEAIHRYDTEAELERYRAHLEELVERRTMELQHTAAELERSNRDLEQFASAVSHDLKEPLRAMAGYATLLQNKYGGRLDDKATAYLAGTVDGAGRMQRLIDDLLSYSRVGSRGGEFKPTDTEAALTAAVANLRVSLEESGAVLTHDPLPAVRSDPSQLVQLFQNLIANAVKFHGAQTPRIHIGAGREDGQWRFWVRDNGIGIDQQFRERIFEIFQRLHPRSAYPGTGIGLAICKRIVERHGGRIGVDSEPGQGATIYFTIPDVGGDA